MLQWDCIILGHLSKIDTVTSIFMNVVELHHRFKMYLKVSTPVKVVDCIIPKPRFKMYPEVSAPMKVVDCIIPEPRFKMYPEVSPPMKVVGLHHP